MNLLYNVKLLLFENNGPKWLSSNIRKMIRKKNRIHRKAQHFDNPMDWIKFRRIRNEVASLSLVRNAKDNYNNDLIQKIVNMNSSCKNWWNIVKQISVIKGSDMSIPLIIHNDNLISDDTEKANLFNITFSKQSEIDDSNSNLHNLSHVTNQISVINFCVNEVEDALKVINPTKASGPDFINHRLLKDATSIIKYLFYILFNFPLLVASYPC